MDKEFHTLVGLVHTLATLPVGSDYLAFKDINAPNTATADAILWEVPPEASDHFALLWESAPTDANDTPKRCRSSHKRRQSQATRAVRDDIAFFRSLL